MNKLIALMALLLTACTTAKQLSAPDGGVAYSIKCGNSNLDGCYEKASELCPNGYTFLNRGHGGVAIIPVGNIFIAARKNDIFVECKN